MGWLYWLCLALPFVLSVLGTAGVRVLAVRRGFVDRPGGHKQHARPIALGGGVAIALAIFLPLMGALVVAWWCRVSGVPPWLPEGIRPHLSGVADKTPVALVIVGGGLVLHLLGLVDDMRPLPPWFKLLAMTGIALVLVWGFGIRAAALLGPVPSIVLTVLWIVGITNAMNLMDNMDGLAAGVACIAGALFAFAAVRTGQIFVPAVTCMMVGAVAGFLVYNFPPASIFMGDSGSLLVGYLLAVLTVLTTFVEPDVGPRPYGMLAPLAILAVPIYDTASVVILRLRLGAKILAGDRRHFSHRLVRRGMSPRSAVLTIYLATLATGLSATQLSRAVWTDAVLVAGQCVVVVLIIALLEQAPGHDPLV